MQCLLAWFAPLLGSPFPKSAGAAAKGVSSRLGSWLPLQWNPDPDSVHHLVQMDAQRWQDSMEVSILGVVNGTGRYGCRLTLLAFECARAYALKVGAPRGRSSLCALPFATTLRVAQRQQTYGLLACSMIKDTFGTGGPSLSVYGRQRIALRWSARGMQIRYRSCKISMPESLIGHPPSQW